MNTSSSDAGTSADAERRRPRRSAAPTRVARGRRVRRRRGRARVRRTSARRRRRQRRSSSSGGRGVVGRRPRPSARRARRCSARRARRARAAARRAAAPRARSAPLRRDTASPSRSSARCARNSDSSFQNSRRDTGSTPVVGSSSRSSSRLVHQRAGQRQLLLHAARQPVGEARAKRRQLRHLEQPVARGARSRGTPWISAKNAMFSSIAQIAVEAEALRQVADRAVTARCSRTGSRPSTRTSPGVAAEQPARQPDRRRLAGAVRADQAEHLARRDLERQAVERRGRAVASCVTRSKRMAAASWRSRATAAAPPRPACPASARRRGCRPRP